MKKMLTAALALALTSGCVYYKPFCVSSTSMGPENETPVRVTTGESTAFYIFGLGPIGNNSLEAAVEDALGDAPADSMVNVFADQSLMVFPHPAIPIIKRFQTTVFGTLVKYKKGQ